MIGAIMFEGKEVGTVVGGFEFDIPAGGARTSERQGANWITRCSIFPTPLKAEFTLDFHASQIEWTATGVVFLIWLQCLGARGEFRAFLPNRLLS